MKGTRAVLVLAVAALLLATAATGQVPEKMNYQVMLTNDSDEPLADQAVQIEFRLYSSGVGGSLYWTETHNTATNSIGVVSVVLGETTPLPTNPFALPLWLEIEVNSEVMAPRRELVSAPYALHSHDSDFLGDEAASEYTLDEDLSTPGSINNPSNPVDWTMLKNVPAGFADGADDVGGSGDGHSLDAVDGNPVDAVYVDASGNVGIGVTAPANRLTVSGLSSVSYAQFANTSTGFGADDGFEVGINGGGYAFINQQEALPITFLTGGTIRAKLTSDGVFEFGSGTSNGLAEFYGIGGGNRSIKLYADPAYGGELELYEESGARFGAFEGDFDGTGGFLSVTGGGGLNGFFVNGNSSGGNARVGITGTVSSTSFDTNASGDDAVALPTGAVSAYEILDEPGVASRSTVPYLNLTGPVQTLLSRSITVPAPGYVLALATATVRALHDNGTISGALFGVSDSSSSFPYGADMYLRVPANADDGEWNPGAAVQWLFEVDTAGMHTFYFLADQVVGNWAVYQRNMTLVYIPSAYGTISSTVAAPPSNPEEATALPGRALTEADIAAERAESMAFSNARLEREFAEMEARVAELESYMYNNRP